MTFSPLTVRGATRRAFWVAAALILIWSRAAVAAGNSSWVAAWLVAQTNCQTWSADLIQTRSLQTLAQPLVSTGRVWFAAPDRFRWEIGTPAATIAVRDPAQMLVIYPKLRRVERYPLRGADLGPWKHTLALMEAGFPRSRAELDERFKVLGERLTNGVCELALEPRQTAARRMLPRLELAFGTNDFDLRATTLHFADGSVLRNVFHNTLRNHPLDNALFAPEIHPSYEVVEPLAKPAKP